MTEHSHETKIAILEAKVEHMMGHVKELTMRVRANEKVVAIVSAIGIGAGGIIGSTAFAPKADAYPQYLEPGTQEPYPGMLSGPAAGANEWIRKMRQWELEQKLKDDDFDINSALAEYFNNGGTDTTEQEELLQLPGNGDQQSIGWRYDRRDDRSWFRPLQKGESKSSGG
tara:strand:+ start:159 stop:668 length:510 start_codon:yes stop_codon:yes gene_type:complete